MNKTLMILIPLMCLAGTIQAQTEQENWEFVNVEVASDKYTVETNKFFANWFTTLNGGIQTYSGSKQDFGFDNLTPMFSVGVGKWFSPTIGVRVMGNGITAGVADERPKYINAQGDLMFNLCNQLGGYKEDRFYSSVPYVGIGWNWIIGNKRAGEICAAAGLQNIFRLNGYFDLNIDLRGTFSRDCYAVEKDGNAYNSKGEKALIASATAGIIFHIPYKMNDGTKYGWGQSRTFYVVNHTNESQLEEAIERLTADNEDLRKAIANCHDTETIVKIIGEAAPILVTFDIDKIDLKKKDRVNLGFFSEIIKAGDPNLVYSITGYADKGTGSVKRNWWLSENRARVVYECLVNEFGINPKQLTTDYKGGVDDMYYDDPKLSRSVIVRAIK